MWGTQQILLLPKNEFQKNPIHKSKHVSYSSLSKCQFNFFFFQIELKDDFEPASEFEVQWPDPFVDPTQKPGSFKRIIDIQLLHSVGEFFDCVDQTRPVQIFLRPFICLLQLLHILFRPFPYYSCSLLIHVWIYFPKLD